MKAKPISQKEARRLRARVGHLEELLSAERRRYAREWPGGTHVASIDNPSEGLRSAVHTARILGHGVVAIVQDHRMLFFALPHPKVPA